MVTRDKATEYLSLPRKAEYRAEINKEAGAFSLNMTDTEGKSTKRAFIPMYTAHDMPYHTYFKRE